MRVAIVGCGEVGSTYARALVAAGRLDLVLVDPLPLPAVSEWAEAHELVLHPTTGTWLVDVDHVWVCVAGDLAHEVVLGLLEHLPPGAVVVDLTTAAPEDKQRSAAAADDGGHGYVDAVIMGAVGLTGVATPLLGAGPRAADALTGLSDLGAPVRTLPGAGPGDAASLKLLRTVLTKGLEALAVECLVAAEQRGVRAELRSVLADIDEAGLTSFLDAVVRTHPLHADRRLHEVRRAGRQLAEQGRPSTLVDATGDRFAATVALLDAAPPAAGTTDDLDGAVRWLHSTTSTTHHRQET